MDAKLKADWVAALRSGKYQQTRRSLKNKSGLCCIGVGYVVCRGRRPNFEATDPAARVLGLSTEQSGHLIGMNDFEEKSFLEIADYIEKNL